MALGKILVVSKRAGGTTAPLGYAVVPVDRTNPVLGNPHILHNHNDAAERDRVIAAYKADFDKDIASRGKRFYACQAIAQRIVTGENIALSCWCAPRPCHGHMIADTITNMANDLQKFGVLTPQSAPQAAPTLFPMPTQPSLPVAGSVMSIIGTAGRRDDAAKINKGLYDRMYAEALSIVKSHPETTAVMSGGAAVADHLAVRLFLSNEVKRLILHLPAGFDQKTRQFVGPDDMSANTANHYHRQFQRSTGIDSLGEIAQAIANPACRTFVNPRGFKARNLDVAKADILVALTFGTKTGRYSINEPESMSADAAGLKDGGTAHTYGASRARTKYHIDLHELIGTRWKEPHFLPAPSSQPAAQPSTSGHGRVLSADEGAREWAGMSATKPSRPPINEFQGEYRFLSNFWPANIELNGQKYPTVEHAYVAAKFGQNPAPVRVPYTTPNSETKYREVPLAQYVAELASPGAAKRFGRTAKVDEYWNERRIPVMQLLTDQKYHPKYNPDLAQKLVRTEDAHICEGNPWGDKFWGQSPLGNGENTLGKMNMHRRDFLQRTPADQVPEPRKEFPLSGPVPIASPDNVATQNIIEQPAPKIAAVSVYVSPDVSEQTKYFGVVEFKNGRFSIISSSKPQTLTPDKLEKHQIKEPFADMGAAFAHLQKTVPGFIPYKPEPPAITPSTPKFATMQTGNQR